MPKGIGTYGSKRGRPPKNLKKGEWAVVGKGIYDNIHAKRKRIANGSGERMRKAGSKGAPTAKNFKRSARTAKKT